MSRYVKRPCYPDVNLVLTEGMKIRRDGFLAEIRKEQKEQKVFNREDWRPEDLSYYTIKPVYIVELLMSTGELVSFHYLFRLPEWLVGAAVKLTLLTCLRLRVLFIANDNLVAPEFRAIIQEDLDRLFPVS